jgi:hypothetical protein
MKKLVALSCLLLTVAVARPLEASTFTLSSLTVDLRDVDPGLVLWYSNPWTGDITLNGAGATEKRDLFKIGTTEGALNLDDIVPFGINVGLGFSQPALFSGSVAGITGAAWLGKSLGYVLWDDPIQLAFGPAGAGLLQIALSNVTFGLPGDSKVVATFTLLKDAPTSVPEPGTLALFAIGAAGIALRRRRKLA